MLILHARLQMNIEVDNNYTVIKKLKNIKINIFVIEGQLKTQYIFKMQSSLEIQKVGKFMRI